MNMIKDVSNFEDYLNSLEYVGFQSRNLGIARNILKNMKSEEKITVFFGFTANLVASGLRGYITKFIRSGLVDVVITTPGAIEHDIMKSFKQYEEGSFNVNDGELHEKGINRIGNIFVPNDRYVMLEEISMKVMEIANEKYNGVVSPSELIYEYARYIKHKQDPNNSFIVEAFNKQIPIFSPGIIDGAIGLHTYFFKQRHEDFKIDVTKDMKKLADIVLNAEKTGAVILGGGITKHHIIGSNIVRGGLDYAIYITTAVEWDGSLSGAKTKEAVSWGKIKDIQKSISVYGDATIIFPLLLEKII